MKRNQWFAISLLALLLAGCGLVAIPTADGRPPTAFATDDRRPATVAAATVDGRPTTARPTTEPTVAPTETPEPPTATSTQSVAPTETVEPPTATLTQSAIGNTTSLPDPAGYDWRLVADGLARPVGLANASDGSNRLFVIEQAGRIRILQDGALLLDNPFLDITGRVGSQANEQGLLGLAFHPRYPENGYFYVNYTDLNGDTVIARFSVSPDANAADPNSETQLLWIDQPFGNHNGGCLVFGPDGYLYIGMGDGGSAGDPQGNAQSLDTLLGKLLRIDVDAGEPYVIPADNPFANGGGLPEIWAYGLRNPWRFSFDRLTGDLFIGDVGQADWEEIDFLPAGSAGGANFGWDYREAGHPFEGQPLESQALVEPVAEYPHNPGYSVTGGYVYRGAALPEFQGVYIYGDYLSGFISGLLRMPDGSWQDEILFSTHVAITSFGEDEAGEIYFTSHQGGVYRLEGK